MVVLRDPDFGWLYLLLVVLTDPDLGGLNIDGGPDRSGFRSVIY